MILLSTVIQRHLVILLDVSQMEWNFNLQSTIQLYKNIVDFICSVTCTICVSQDTAAFRNILVLYSFYIVLCFHFILPQCIMMKQKMNCISESNIDASIDMSATCYVNPKGACGKHVAIIIPFSHFLISVKKLIHTVVFVEMESDQNC